MLGAALLFANVVATRRLWASELFETSQKVAQTALMWVVPGGVLLVWSVLRERKPGSERDPAIAGVTFVVDFFAGSGAFARDAGDVGHHGVGHHGGDHHGPFHDGGFGGGGHGGGGHGGDGGGH